MFQGGGSLSKRQRGAFNSYPGCQFLIFYDIFIYMIKLMELYGKKIELQFTNQHYGGTNIYPSLLSLNVKPDELPYRLTWFQNDEHDVLEPRGHIDITREEYNLLMNNIIPTSIGTRYQWFLKRGPKIIK